MKTARDGYFKAAHVCNTGVLLTKNEVNIAAEMISCGGQLDTGRIM